MYSCHSAGTTSTAICLRLVGTNVTAIGMRFYTPLFSKTLVTPIRPDFLFSRILERHA